MLSIGAFAAQPEKWSPGTLFISSADTDAAQQQEIKEDSLELRSTSCVFLSSGTVYCVHVSVQPDQMTILSLVSQGHLGFPIGTSVGNLALLAICISELSVWFF